MACCPESPTLRAATRTTRTYPPCLVSNLRAKSVKSTDTAASLRRTANALLRNATAGDTAFAQSRQFDEARHSFHAPLRLSGTSGTAEIANAARFDSVTSRSTNGRKNFALLTVVINRPLPASPAAPADLDANIKLTAMLRSIALRCDAFLLSFLPLLLCLIFNRLKSNRH
jgi:hypothetical protein